MSSLRMSKSLLDEVLSQVRKDDLKPYRCTESGRFYHIVCVGKRSGRLYLDELPKVEN